MKNIKLTNQSYSDLLQLKNHITIKCHFISNKEILEYIDDNPDKLGIPLFKKFDTRKVDYEPEYSFSQYITDITGMIWEEQDTGHVMDIT